MMKNNCSICGKPTDGPFLNAKVAHWDCLYNELKEQRENVQKIYHKNKVKKDVRDT